MRSSSRSDVDPFIVMDVMEAARKAEAAGRDIIHMEVGQPGTGAPKAAREALARAMEAGPMGYTVALGLPELRQGIADLYQEWYALDLNPDRVIVTAGASGAFLLAFTRFLMRVKGSVWASPAIPHTGKFCAPCRSSRWVCRPIPRHATSPSRSRSPPISPA